MVRKQEIFGAKQNTSNTVPIQLSTVPPADSIVYPTIWLFLRVSYDFFFQLWMS